MLNNTLTENPYELVEEAILKKIPARRKRNRYLELDEEKMLREQLVGQRKHLLPIFEIGLLTGMQLGEILGLKWKFINFSDDFRQHNVEGTWFNLPPSWLLIHRTKSRRPRMIPMSEAVRKVLLDLRNESSSLLVFFNWQTGKQLLSIKTAWTSVREDAGVNEFTFHDLRHTWSTRGADRGVPESVRRDILGHSSGSITADYTHASRIVMEEAMELVASYEEWASTKSRQKSIKGAVLPTVSADKSLKQ
jgi:integrase